MDDTAVHRAVPRVDTTLVHAHGIAALVTLLVSVTCGIIVAFQLLYPDLGAGARVDLAVAGALALADNVTSVPAEAEGTVGIAPKAPARAGSANARMARRAIDAHGQLPGLSAEPGPQELRGEIRPVRLTTADVRLNSTQCARHGDPSAGIRSAVASPIHQATPLRSTCTSAS